MTCQYLDSGTCSLGYFGGNPRVANCKICISKGNNNPEAAAELFASRERTHPSSVPKVSGCCDSALNPPQ